LLTFVPYLVLKAQIQTPFNIITIIIDVAVQRMSIAMVKITYFLRVLEILVLVCFFQIIVGKTTMLIKITTANIS